MLTDPSPSLNSTDLALFHETGCAGPFRLCEPAEAGRNLAAIRRVPRLLFPWTKGGHCMSRSIYQLGSSPEIVARVRSVLGDNVLLWGSILIPQAPGIMHPWHVDAEHVQWEGVTVWLALANVTYQSGFGVVTRTHRFAHSWKELHGSRTLDLRDDNAVLAKAQMLDARCTLIHCDISDGEYVLMHGKTWHSTRNLTNKVRFSLVLQYARPDCRMRIPERYLKNRVVWSSAQPPCILVSGKDEHGMNRLIDPTEIASLGNRMKGCLVHFPRNCLRVLRQRIANGGKRRHRTNRPPNSEKPYSP